MDLASAPLPHPAVGAALRAVRSLTGVEAAFLGTAVDDVVSVHWLDGDPARPWPELRAGSPFDRTQAVTVEQWGVGLPDTSPWGSLVCADRGPLAIDDRVRSAVAELALVAAHHLHEPPDLTVTRVAGTWRVAGHGADDLVSAMVLGDLIATELDALPVAGRPDRTPRPDDETERLRLTVSQLERALSARVVIEQAIGVLAERRRTSPRQAFEQLRGVARGGGRKVHDLAGEIVRSTTTPQRLPHGLARPDLPGTAPVRAAPSPAAVARAVTGR